MKDDEGLFTGDSEASVLGWTCNVMNLDPGKVYNVQNNVGKAKYIVNFHDGEKKHPDGSPFYDIEISKNKRDLGKFVKKLEADGYKLQ
jgi:hypothetical protein